MQQLDPWFTDNFFNVHVSLIDDRQGNASTNGSWQVQQLFSGLILLCGKSIRLLLRLSFCIVVVVMSIA
jgi:hypothetical protein